MKLGIAVQSWPCWLYVDIFALAFFLTNNLLLRLKKYRSKSEFCRKWRCNLLVLEPVKKKKIRNQNKNKMATSVDENDSDVQYAISKENIKCIYQLLLVTASLDKGGPNTKKMQTWTLPIIIGLFKPKHLAVLYWFFSDSRLDKLAEFQNWNGKSGKKCKWKGRGRN